MHVCLLKNWKRNSMSYKFWKEVLLEEWSDFTFLNLSLNSHSQNKSKQDSVAPSRRRKSRAVVQTTSQAFSGKSQFQLPEGHSVGWTVRDEMSVPVRSFGNLYVNSEFLDIFRWGRFFVLRGKQNKKRIPDRISEKGVVGSNLQNRAGPQTLWHENLLWEVSDGKNNQTS